MLSNEECTIMDQANACARSMALRWIRRTFREVSLQVLKRLLTATTVGDNGVVTVEVTNAQLEACERTCRRLGELWCQRLRHAGQDQMAEWVQQVMDMKRFWESDYAVLAHEECSRSRVDPARAQAPPSTERTSGDNTIEESSLKWSSDFILPLTRLRRLGQRDPLSNEPCLDPQVIVRTLDDMGRRGQTAWPYDWNIIEDAALNNTKRLHSETLKGRPRIVTKTTSDFEVIPKSLIESEQDDVPSEPQKPIDEIVSSRSSWITSILEKKRKAAEPPPQDVLLRRQQGPFRHGSDPPRAPSHLGEEEHWSWRNVVVESLTNRDELERSMIHPEEDSLSEEPHSVVGSLKDVGKFHKFLQHSAHGEVDAEEEEEELTDKHQRREVRKARKERLFPHVIEKEARDPQLRWTKVIRTIGDRDHWLELDIGECLMEIVSPNSNRKTLCAFSSLEIVLKDEDAWNEALD